MSNPLVGEDRAGHAVLVLDAGGVRGERLAGQGGAVYAWGAGRRGIGGLLL